MGCGVGDPPNAKTSLKKKKKKLIFNKCPIYTHDDASAKFSTNSHETDYGASYSAVPIFWR
jgi:hypothetical protein